MKFKSRISELRKKSGLSQAQLGVFVGVSTNTIQSWEKPDGLSQLEKYLKLAEVLGIKRLIDLFEIVEPEEESYKSEDNKLKPGELSLSDLRELRKGWAIEEKTEEKNSSTTKTTRAI